MTKRDMLKAMRPRLARESRTGAPCRITSDRRSKNETAVRWPAWGHDALAGARGGHAPLWAQAKGAIAYGAVLEGGCVIEGESAAI